MSSRRSIRREIEIACSTDCAFGKPGHQCTFRGLPPRAMLSQIGFNIGSGEALQLQDHTPRTDGGKQLSSALGQQENRREFRRLLQDFQQGIGGLFHESCVREDEDALPSIEWLEIDRVDYPS